MSTSINNQSTSTKRNANTPLNLSGASINDKRSRLVEQINNLNFQEILQQMNNDTSTPPWVKALMTQMQQILTLTSELLLEQQQLNGNQQSRQLQYGEFKQEMEEKERRHCLVLNGLPESEQAKSVEKAKDDQQRVLQVLNECKVSSALPSGIFRMGKINQNKPRPIKIKFPCSYAVREALSGKKFLKNQHKHLHLRESLSKTELANRSALIRQCHEKRQAHPGADFVIYAGMVILREEIPIFRTTINTNPHSKNLISTH